MYFLLDDKSVEEDDRKELFSLVLRWAMEHECAVRVEFSVISKPTSLMQMLTDVSTENATFGYATASVVAEKKQAFIAWLLSEKVPENADGGDLCPLQHVEIISNGDRVFLSADYGRTIIVGCSERSKSDLQSRIGSSFGPDVCLVPTTQFRRG